MHNGLLFSFLGRGVVDAPLRAVGDFTGELQSTFTWDNTLVVIYKYK